VLPDPDQVAVAAIDQDPDQVVVAVIVPGLDLVAVIVGVADLALQNVPDRVPGGVVVVMVVAVMMAVSEKLPKCSSETFRLTHGKTTFVMILKSLAKLRTFTCRPTGSV
jgi:hypothetical protein